MNSERIVGIYDADGGWRGEVRYAVRLLAGGGHCSLCDITHGFNPLGRKDWKRACAQAPFEISFIHRDQATEVQRAVAAVLPAVLAGGDDSWRLLVGAEELESCAGDPDRLIMLIQDRLTRT